MDMIFPILCGLLILVGLAAVIMSRTNWRVYQIILVVFVLLANAAFLYLAARTLYTHREWRSEVAKYERAYAGQYEQFKTLTGELDGRGEVVVDRDEKKAREMAWTVDDWKAEATEVFYGRGRVLGGLTPNKVDPATGVITAAPGSASFPKQSTVFVFEMNSIRNRPPGRYLGQYIVTNADDAAITLTPVNPEQATDTRAPLAIYEVAPVDSHDAFADFSPDDLKAMFPQQLVPPEIAQQYLKDGKPADLQNDPPEHIWRRVQFKQEHKLPGGDAEPVAANAEQPAADAAAVPEGDDAAPDQAAAPIERKFAVGDQAILDPQTAKDLVDRGIAEYVESKPEEGIFSHVYVRPLNDYPAAFRDIRSQLLAANLKIAELDRQLLAVDNSIKLAQQSEQVRKDEARRLTDDLNKFTAEAELIEKHHDALVASVKGAQGQNAAYKQAIGSQAAELARLQLEAAEAIRGRGPTADAAAAR